MSALYSTTVTSSGPRRGRAASTDGRLAVELDIPTQLGGKGLGTDPEQLFAAGYAACFHSALARVAKARGASTAGAEVTAHVSLVSLSDGRFGLEVELEVWLPEVAAEQAQELLALAHEVCPYSNATRGNLDVGLRLAQEARAT